MPRWHALHASAHTPLILCVLKISQGNKFMHMGLSLGRHTCFMTNTLTQSIPQKGNAEAKVGITDLTIWVRAEPGFSGDRKRRLRRNFKWLTHDEQMARTYFMCFVFMCFVFWCWFSVCRLQTGGTGIACCLWGLWFYFSKWKWQKSVIQCEGKQKRLGMSSNPRDLKNIATLSKMQCMLSGVGMV